MLINYHNNEYSVALQDTVLYFDSYLQAKSFIDMMSGDFKPANDNDGIRPIVVSMLSEIINKWGRS